MIINFRKPSQKEYFELTVDLTPFENILTESENFARQIAARTLKETKQKTGLQ